MSREDNLVPTVARLLIKERISKVMTGPLLHFLGHQLPLRIQ